MSKIVTWDEYEIKARYIPCFITAVFPVHFAILFLGKSFWETITSNIGWLTITNVSISLVLTIALIQLQCGIAKHWIEESIFGKGGINFPTTKILLFQNPFLSRSMKNALRDKIKKDFKFEIMNASQEQTDIDEARRLSREAVGLIRRYVGKGVMVHQYNIRYGFIRNLIGGALWGIASSIGCAIWYGSQKNWRALTLFIVCSILLSTLLLFKKRILEKYAYQYAETLFNEYLIQQGPKK